MQFFSSFVVKLFIANIKAVFIMDESISLDL